MSEFAFDFKLLGVCRVKAASEARARELLARYGDCLDLGINITDGEVMERGESLHFTEGSVDGEADLFEVDGREPTE